MLESCKSRVRKPGRFIVSKRLLKYSLLVLGFIFSSLFLQLLELPAIEAASPNVVISQVYGGGGNSGATYRNDFIELFNLGSSPVSLNNWTVQYASASG